MIGMSSRAAGPALAPRDIGMMFLAGTLPSWWSVVICRSRLTGHLMHMDSSLSGLLMHMDTSLSGLSDVGRTTLYM